MKPRAIEVTWIPAHVGYGVISMLRYWQAMERSWEADDPFRIHSLFDRDFHSESLRARGKWERMVVRKILYPWRVRTRCEGRIAHVLDHSWADMLAYVPSGVRTVVTVHDLIPLRFAGGLSAGQVTRFRAVVEQVRRADRVVCISEYTKREVIELLDIPEKKIRVVPNGVEAFPEDEEAAVRMRSRMGGEPGSLLLGCIGNTLERKNLKVLAPALALVKARGMHVTLVRAGAPLPAPLREEIRAAVGAKHLVELGVLRDDELGPFYRAVDGVVVPSTYEGFGLPLLEAMAAGTPVLSSSATSLPEVGGGAALYFDPASPEELAERLREWSDPVKRVELSRKGLERAAAFSWRKTLEGMYAVYAELAGEEEGAHRESLSAPGGKDGMDSTVTETPRVAVVFASFNRKEIAVECVRRLRAQSRRPDWVVVADNASSSGGALDAWAALGWDALEVLPLPENIGNAGGVRVAMERAFALGADAVWILDDDSWPEPGALEALLEGDWNPRIVRHSVQIDPRSGDYSWPLPLRDGKAGWRLMRKPEEWPGGMRVESRAAWTGALVPRMVWEKVGPVMGDLFIRGEDEEYPRRIAAAGFRFEAVRDSLLQHPAAERLIGWHGFGRWFWFEPGLADWKFYYEARNTIWIKRREGAWARALMLAGLYAIALLVHGPRDRAHFLAWRRAVADAWMNRLGKWEHTDE
ncbi:MAG TPA: glycosyltransferase [Luteolibacter sp.]